MTESAKDDLISRRGVVEACEKMAADAQDRIGLVPGNVAFENGRIKAANALADEFTAADSVEMRTTTSGHSQIVIDKYKSLEADLAAIRARVESDYRHVSLKDEHGVVMADLHLLIGMLNLTTEFWEDAQKETDELRAFTKHLMQRLGTLAANSITQGSATASELATKLPESQRRTPDYTPLVEIDANGNVVPVTPTPVQDGEQLKPCPFCGEEAQSLGMLG